MYGCCRGRLTPFTILMYADEAVISLWRLPVTLEWRSPTFGQHSRAEPRRANTFRLIQAWRGSSCLSKNVQAARGFAKFIYLHSRHPQRDLFSGSTKRQTDQRCTMAPNNKKKIMLNLEKHGSSENLIKPASVGAVQTLATLWSTDVALTCRKTVWKGSRLSHQEEVMWLSQVACWFSSEQGTQSPPPLSAVLKTDGSNSVTGTENLTSTSWTQKQGFTEFLHHQHTFQGNQEYKPAAVCGAVLPPSGQ